MTIYWYIGTLRPQGLPIINTRLRCLFRSPQLLRVAAELFGQRPHGQQGLLHILMADPYRSVFWMCQSECSSSVSECGFKWKLFNASEYDESTWHQLGLGDLLNRSLDPSAGRVTLREESGNCLTSYSLQLARGTIAPETCTRRKPWNHPSSGSSCKTWGKGFLGSLVTKLNKPMSEHPQFSKPAAFHRRRFSQPRGHINISVLGSAGSHSENVAKPTIDRSTCAASSTYAGWRTPFRVQATPGADSAKRSAILGMPHLCNRQVTVLGAGFSIYIYIYLPSCRTEQHAGGVQWRQVPWLTVDVPNFPPSSCCNGASGRFADSSRTRLDRLVSC